MYTRVLALLWICIATGELFGQFRTDNQAGTNSVQLLAVGRLNGDLRDLSGLTGKLETDTPADQLGGFSAIDYCAEANRYFVLSDRGPGDGAASFACRFHEFTLQIDVNRKLIQPRLLKTTLLKNASGSQLSGSLEALRTATTTEPTVATQSVAFDCEGIRCLNPKSMAISDEYGPSLRLFGTDGMQQKQWTLPADFRLCENPAARGARGTFPNRGIEGLALSTDGKLLIAAMQGPLVQDGVVEGEKCLGLNTRWLVLDSQSTTNPPLKQLLYRLTDESTGISEVLAVDRNRFLVLERDSNSGAEAKFKHVYLADIREATDVTSQTLPKRGELPAGVTAISKTLLIDLLDERFGLGGDLTAEKPEGLCWGPNLEDGRRLLIVCADNDFETDRKSEFYAFAVAL